MTDDDRLVVSLAMRERLEARNAEGLVRLLTDREELRGVSALADQLGDAVLWCA
ncbi:MAG: hypothetical protein QM714_14005 [Nocardioides sp.]|uniref:hypothetical protein n=1 Tax=Nocardioides sp. TaxID=35761 RepID=UPI0039E3BF5F